MTEFHDWFRCPFCGDEGETKLFLVGGSGGVEFTCQSREHQLNRRRFSRFEREEWRQRDDTYRSKSIFTRMKEAFIGESSDKMGELNGCVECPTCGSATADGAIEQMIVERNYSKYAVILATVWCPKCNTSESSMLSSGEHSIKPTEEASAKSEFPPEYIEL